MLGSFCDYFPSAEGAVLMRAKAWDKAAPQYIGHVMTPFYTAPFVLVLPWGTMGDTSTLRACVESLVDTLPPVNVK